MNPILRNPGNDPSGWDFVSLLYQNPDPEFDSLEAFGITLGILEVLKLPDYLKGIREFFIPFATCICEANPLSLIKSKFPGALDISLQKNILLTIA